MIFQRKKIPAEILAKIGQPKKVEHEGETLVQLTWSNMKIPNWQHHSKKDRKRHLKPQALRQARKRRNQLTKCLLNRPKGRFSCNNVYIQTS